MQENKLLSNTTLSNGTNRLLSCSECGFQAGFISSAAKAYRITYICSCNSLCNVEINNPKSLTGGFVIKDKNNFICPSCNEILFSVNLKAIKNLSFTIKCKCGFCGNAYKNPENLSRFSGSEIEKYLHT